MLLYIWTLICISVHNRSWLEHGKPHGNGPVLDDDILADPAVKACIEEGSKARERGTRDIVLWFTAGPSSS